MKITKRSLAIVATCVLSSAVGITTITSIDSDVHTASALSYSTSKDISFTFAPTLSIGLSTGSLTIDNLVPGNISDSNSVKVTVSSNTPYGYVLSAGVGSSDSASTYYNTSNLVHEDNTVNNAFTSIATSASEETLTTDNTWGYSTSLDGGTTWSTYSGLPSTTTKPLLDISDPATPSTIDFKIAAKSSTTQASGTYNNVITFYAVGKPKPVYMQETEIIKSRLKNVGDELQAIDQRDGKKYWIAKQADGNIWMTQNLDLCIGCEGTATLTSQNTDLNESGIHIYKNGYTKSDDGVITWTPPATAITSNRMINDNTVSPAFGGNYDRKPYSAEGGDTYIFGPTSRGRVESIIYKSIDECLIDGYSVDDCMHFHIGNYYSGSAALASNNIYNSALPDNYSATNSICPAGWRLPEDSPDSSSLKEFKKLFEASDVKMNNYMRYKKNLFDFPLYFVVGGYIFQGYYNLSYGKDGFGYYWSSVIDQKGYYVFGTFFGDFYAFDYYQIPTNYGAPVRCLVK